MRVLLTGFEPFGGSPINPSEEVIKRLVSAPPVGFDLHTTILPVDHQRGPDKLIRAIDQAQPDAVICLMHHLATRPIRRTIPAGFIHLPRLPEQAAVVQSAHPESGPIPSMGLETQVRGVEAALKALGNPC